MRHIIYYPGSQTPNGKHHFFAGFNPRPSAARSLIGSSKWLVRWDPVVAHIVEDQDLAQCLKDLDKVGEKGFKVKKIDLR